MPDDEIYPRESVEDTVDTQPEGISLHVHTKLEYSHTECNPVVIELLLKARLRSTRMNVHTSVKFLDSNLERIIFWLIKL